MDIASINPVGNVQAVASVQGALLSCSYGVLGSLRVSEGARCGLGLFWSFLRHMWFLLTSPDLERFHFSNLFWQWKQSLYQLLGLIRLRGCLNWCLRQLPGATETSSPLQRQ